MLTLEQQQLIATGAPAAGGPGLADILSLLKRRVWFLALPLVLGGAIGLGVTFAIPPEYEVSTRIEVIDRGLLDKFFGQVAFTLPHKPFMEIISHVIRSRDFLQKLVDKHGVREGFDPSDPRERIRLYDTVVKNVKVSLQKQDTGSDILDITYRGRNAATVTAFVDAVKTEFMTRFLDAYTGQIKDAREKLKAQVEAARARHKTVADRLESFQVQHDIRNVGATVLSQKTDALQTSESALYAEQNKLAGKRRQLASLDESLSGMSATAVTSVRQKNPARESQEARIRGLETELEAMLVKLTPENKRVKDKEAEIERERTRLAEIPEFLSREEQLQNAAYAQLVLDRAKVEGEVKLAEGTIRSLESKIAELKAEVKDNPRITRQYSELREQEDRALGEMQLKERLLAQADNLWDRLRTADSDFFRVLKAPRIDEARNLTPVYPQPLLFMGAGAFVGLLLGAGLALVLEFTNRAYVSVGQVRRALPLPILGQVGAIRSSEQDRARMRRRILVVAAVAALAVVIGLFHLCYFTEGLRQHLHPAIFNLMQKIYGGR